MSSENEHAQMPEDSITSEQHYTEQVDNTDISQTDSKYSIENSGTELAQWEKLLDVKLDKVNKYISEQQAKLSKIQRQNNKLTQNIDKLQSEFKKMQLQSIEVITVVAVLVTMILAVIDTA
jgi:septal ring factor EnvC (AmiA/AmiB activator)